MLFIYEIFDIMGETKYIGVLNMKDKTKEDKRVTKTKEKIKLAFSRLLKEKPIQEIKVIEIAEKANINRGTFYQHYNDVIDLLDKTEKEVCDDFYAFLKSARSMLNENSSYEDNKKAFNYFLVETLKYIQNNYEVANALFGQNGDRKYIIKLQNYVKDAMRVDLKDSNIDQEQIDYLFSYISAGTIESIRLWIETDFHAPVNDLANFIQSLMLQGISFFNN